MESNNFEDGYERANRKEKEALSAALESIVDRAKYETMKSPWTEEEYLSTLSERGHSDQKDNVEYSLNKIRNKIQTKTLTADDIDSVQRVDDNYWLNFIKDDLIKYRDGLQSGDIAVKAEVHFDASVGVKETVKEEEKQAVEKPKTAEKKAEEVKKEEVKKIEEIKESIKNESEDFVLEKFEKSLTEQERHLYRTNRFVYEYNNIVKPENEISSLKKSITEGSFLFKAGIKPSERGLSLKETKANIAKCEEKIKEAREFIKKQKEFFEQKVPKLDYQKMSQSEASKAIFKDPQSVLFLEGVVDNIAGYAQHGSRIGGELGVGADHIGLGDFRNLKPVHYGENAVALNFVDTKNSYLFKPKLGPVTGSYLPDANFYCSTIVTYDAPANVNGRHNLFSLVVSPDSFNPKMAEYLDKNPSVMKFLVDEYSKTLDPKFEEYHHTLNKLKNAEIYKDSWGEVEIR